MTVSTSDLLRRSPLLVERWNLRRREAVEMLALAVREGTWRARPSTISQRRFTA
ncbi:hypothetical protein [Qipengyuania oceanensis]|uniref:Uncharacterized protein n=1 Tax=Qipengyuania oceanensis TaxID=1463597 RepID=A0A844YGI3_9SPHN|nr:hypothetical protein [Qipengyuania oceanensis]MXO62635.1 hypothetical protein [Qipengyuania oceanensis]